MSDQAAPGRSATVKSPAAVPRGRGNPDLIRTLISEQLRLPNNEPRYPIVRRRGRGAEGVVYEAIDVAADRRVVALKVLAPEMFDGSLTDEARSNEAAALGQLCHPHIPTLHTVEYVRRSETHIQRLLVMQFIDGSTLRDTMCRRMLLPFKLKVLSIICGAIQHAHDRAVLHSDIKPDNIIIDTREKPWLVDFGIATLGRTSVSHSGVGTRAYQAPEALRLHRIDRRTDLWAVGVVLFEWLTGQRPFRGESDRLIANILHATPDWKLLTSAVSDELSERHRDTLCHIVQRALTRSPEDRYQAAADMKHDLDTLLDSLPWVDHLGTGHSLVTRSEQSPHPRPMTWSRLRPRRLAYATIIAAASAAASVGVHRGARYTTPVPGIPLVSSSSWPPPDVHPQLTGRTFSPVPRDKRTLTLPTPSLAMTGAPRGSTRAAEASGDDATAREDSRAAIVTPSLADAISEVDGDTPTNNNSPLVSVGPDVAAGRRLAAGTRLYVTIVSHLRATMLPGSTFEAALVDDTGGLAAGTRVIGQVLPLTGSSAGAFLILKLIAIDTAHRLIPIETTEYRLSVTNMSVNVPPPPPLPFTLALTVQVPD